MAGIKTVLVTLLCVAVLSDKVSSSGKHYHHQGKGKHHQDHHETLRKPSGKFSGKHHKISEIKEFDSKPQDYSIATEDYIGSPKEDFLEISGTVEKNSAEIVFHGKHKEERNSKKHHHHSGKKHGKKHGHHHHSDHKNHKSEIHLKDLVPKHGKSNKNEKKHDELLLGHDKFDSIYQSDDSFSGYADPDQTFNNHQHHSPSLHGSSDKKFDRETELKHRNHGTVKIPEGKLQKDMKNHKNSESEIFPDPEFVENSEELLADEHDYQLAAFHPGIHENEIDEPELPESFDHHRPGKKSHSGKTHQNANSAPVLSYPDVCTLPMDVGPCSGIVLRFYYDQAADTCREMVYGGCDGNDNNFETVVECQKVCGGGIVPTLPPDGSENRHCYQPRDTGPCLQALVRWYYDSRTATCRQFEYGGCDGNRNRFLTEEMCAAECMPDETEPTEPATTTTTTTTTTMPAETSTQEGEDVCSLPQDSGECVNHFPSWYYNKDTGVCSEFVYGGCGGNGNRFETQEQCEYKCVSRPSNVTGLDRCALHKEVGPCKASYNKYYYDTQEGRCLPFVYGGCQGNENNFDTEAECRSACSLGDICRLPKKEGPCHSSKPRYHFNAVTGQCEGFYYGGCDGNANRFLSIENCQRVCKPPTEQPQRTTTQPDVEPVGSTTPDSGVNVCKLRKDPGPCKGYNPVWYFEPNTRTCRRFLYGGCDGNGNRFATRDECQAECLNKAPATTRRPITSTTEVYVMPESTEPDQDFTSIDPGSGSETTTDSMEFDMCLMEKSAGEYCTGWELRWYFDHVTASCMQFYYGGCAGNANRFATQDDCMKMCVERKQTSPQDPDVCSQIKDVGPCKAFQLRYYFDQSEGRCLSFQFGGCQGNENNFVDEKDCYMTCSDHMGGGEPTEKSKSDCSLGKEPGPCFAEFIRFYFDEESGQCRPFMYGGCQGNGNNFETQNDCHQMCLEDEEERKDTHIYSPGDCYDPSDPGPCPASTAMWYFDHNHGDCRPFYYGCEGNGNRFLSFEDCSAYCSKVTETCGVLQCNLECHFGYARYPDGCPKCECRDPCLSHECPSDQECRIEEVVCVTEPCKPQIVCKPKPKAGECPKVEAENAGMCVTECEEDIDCSLDAKCCSNGCAKVCVVPYVPECQKSVFGCCPDGESKATGWNFIGCPEEAPTISDFGQVDITAVEGETVTIPCVARGAPAPVVSWYKSLNSLNWEDNPHMSQLDDESLEIVGVKPDDSTSYTCRAYNNVGSATKTYTLQVHVPVTLVEISGDIRVNPGEDIMLNCIATGNPTPEIRWLHGNQVIQASNPRYFVDTDGTLIINRAVESDEGVYMCEANNGVGEPVTDTTNVDVLGQYYVNIAPHNTTLSPGDDLSLTCQLDGDTTDVMLTWLKDGFPIMEDEDDRIIMTTQGELLVEDMIMEDAGSYTCTATRLDTEISKVTHIELKRLSMPENCVDKPWYANCDLIVEARMCRHVYFSIFCCLTCHQAGLLP